MLAVFLTTGVTGVAGKPTENETEQHNWQEYSTHYETVKVRSHDYTYWKNFIEKTRTCNVSHKLKAVVYYCDVHDHTHSEIFLEDTIHSEKHS